MPFSLVASSPPTCLEAALAYAHAGLPVFPVSGKVPFPYTRGFYDATINAQTIQAWWRRWPQANIAIPTGKRSGWVVLDVDGRHDGFRSLRHLAILMQRRHEGEVGPFATRMARTGSGVHLFFRMPADELRNTTGIAGLAGIDLRAEGGYVVVAPSLHPNGSRYVWLSSNEPAPFPSGLLELLRQRGQVRQAETAWRASQQKVASTNAIPQREADPDYWLAVALRKAQRGTRHTYALFLSCRLIEHARLTPCQAKAYIQRYVERVPGGGEDYLLSDALRCLEWAAAHI